MKQPPDEEPRVEPFTTHVAEDDLHDLRARLAQARLPEPETNHGLGPGPQRWSQGVPLRDLINVIDYWRTEYDWRPFEQQLNDIGQYTTIIDGLRVHFLHHRSSQPGAVPLIMTHGWPGSVAEFTHLIKQLTAPAETNAQAFHVVVPSLPGFGYSDKPATTGWNVERIATAWVELMRRLGYERFLAHGGDWGGIVTTVLGGRYPEHIIGIHTTVAQPPPGLPTSILSTEEAAWAKESQEFWQSRAAYAKVQAQQPQTIGTALVDSPVGQLAWIMDKFFHWSDTYDSPFEAIPIDRLLDDVTLYWLTRTGASAARIYAESHASLDPELRVNVPTAICTYPKDIEKWPRPWAQQRFHNIVRWNTAPGGGHFPSLECPEFFTADLFAGLQSLLEAG